MSEISVAQCLLQLLFNFSFLLTASAVTLRGIFLPDLAVTYGSNLTVAGISLASSALGGIIGCNLAGLIREKFPNHPHAIIATSLTFCGIANGLLPFGRIMFLFCLLNFTFSFCGSISFIIVNACVLKTWRNSSFGADPFVHSLYLFYIIGLFITPLLSIPFLGSKQEVSPEQQRISEKSALEIPFVACSILFIIIACCIYKMGASTQLGGVAEESNVKMTNEESDKREEEEKVMPSSYLWKKRCLICLTCLFYILDYNLICGIASYLIPAVGHSMLRLSDVEGAFLVSLFFLGQLLIAAVNSILSRWLRPNHTLCISLILTLASVLLLFFSWDQSKLLLQVSFLILGLGSGSMLANSLVWLDQFIPVGAKITGFLQATSSCGLLTSGLIFGPYVVTFPRIFPCYILIHAASLPPIFALGTIWGRSLKKQREDLLKMISPMETLALSKEESMKKSSS